jgi:N12 class adenine-specific DNA methylase
MIEEELPELDYDKIRNLEIKKSPSGEQNIIIENKDEIKSILNNLFNNELRIYNGGRLDISGSEYELSINLYGSRYRYIIGEEYIMSRKVDLYKVLDDKNSVFEYLESLYEEKQNIF